MLAGIHTTPRAAIEKRIHTSRNTHTHAHRHYNTHTHTYIHTYMNAYIPTHDTSERR